MLLSVTVFRCNGNLIEQTDQDGYVTSYAYSPIDLVTNINYNGVKEVHYAYNKVGQLVKMDDWLGTTTYEVDLLRQLTRVTDHIAVVALGYGFQVLYQVIGVAHHGIVGIGDGAFVAHRVPWSVSAQLPV